MGKGEKLHVLCVPLPLQGHITPMLKLAKLFHHKGFHVTFVNSEFNHRRVLDSRGPRSLDGLPDFRFETFPLDLPPSTNSLPQTMLALREACRRDFSSRFSDLLVRINSDSLPRVSLIVSDAFLTYTLPVSEKLGIPNVLLWNMGASGFVSFVNSRHQIERCVALLKDPESSSDSEEFDAPLEWIPGMKGAKLRDLAKIVQTMDPNKFLEISGTGELERASKASGMIFHTFDTLEGYEIDKLLPISRTKVYGIGPLQLMLNKVSHGFYESVECSLWSEEPGCLRWLDSKQPSSVVYINFGSTTLITAEQMAELASGVTQSGHNFLLIIRPDMIMGDSDGLLQPFLNEAKDYGFVASWCLQEQVLNHPSVGAFLTHCGWNSTVESICAGVPMICWPFFGDQFVNCRKICNDWRVGIELSKDFHGEEVRKLVDEILVGEQGKKMKSNAAEWRSLAQKAVASSSASLDTLVADLLSSNDLTRPFV